MDAMSKQTHRDNRCNMLVCLATIHIKVNIDKVQSKRNEKKVGSKGWTQIRWQANALITANTNHDAFKW